MNCDCMRVLVDHDSIALEVVVKLAVAVAADDSVTVLEDNNIHFDYVNRPANK